MNPRSAVSLIAGLVLLELVSAASSPQLNRLTDLPEEFDWRKVPGRVSTPKDQGSCISDGAFAVVGLLEGQLSSHNVTFTDLSAQNLIDCATVEEDSCEFGGDAEHIMEQLSKLGGIQTEADYPYKQHAYDCHYDSSKSVLPLRRAQVERVPYSDEEALMSAIVQYGPVAVTMATDPFYRYTSGIRDCGDFATVAKSALLVGYGKDPKEGNYWIVKNNRGKQWGEQGYVRVARSKRDSCHVTMYAYILRF